MAKTNIIVKTKNPYSYKFNDIQTYNISKGFIEINLKDLTTEYFNCDFIERIQVSVEIESEDNNEL